MREATATAAAAARRLAEEAAAAAQKPFKLKKAEREKIFTSFQALDADGSGTLDVGELGFALDDPEIKQVLEANGISIEKDAFVQLLDPDNKGDINVLQFINSVELYLANVGRRRAVLLGKAAAVVPASAFVGVHLQGLGGEEDTRL